MPQSEPTKIFDAMFRSDRRGAAASHLGELEERLGLTRDDEVTVEDLLDPAGEAEGQVVWTRPSPPVTGRRLVSFLVSYMFVYLRPSPSTTGL